MKADRVFKIGSPLFEVINKNRKKIKESFYLKKNNLKKNKFFLISFHREENVENTKNISNFIEMLSKLEKKYRLPILISTHPDSKKN